MNKRLSKLAKITIVINIVLAIIIGSIHTYNVYRIKETNDIILEKMAEKNVIRDSAIYLLEQEGVDLFLGQELTTIFGLFASLLSIFLLIMFAKNVSFFYGFGAAFTGVFTSFLGGFALFYVLLSGKSEINISSERQSFKNDWEKFIYNKSVN